MRGGNPIKESHRKWIDIYEKTREDWEKNILLKRAIKNGFIFMRKLMKMGKNPIYKRAIENEFIFVKKNS